MGTEYKILCIYLKKHTKRKKNNDPGGFSPKYCGFSIQIHDIDEYMYIVYCVHEVCVCTVNDLYQLGPN